MGVCSFNLQFQYILAGWEGSAADSHVLQSSLSCDDPLVVPNGKYYTVDLGYPSIQGFIAPYHRTRYHLNDYGHDRERPQNYKELFNKRHYSLRNAIECAFGVLKDTIQLEKDIDDDVEDVRETIVSLDNDDDVEELGDHEDFPKTPVQSRTNGMTTNPLEKSTSAMPSRKKKKTKVDTVELIGITVKEIGVAICRVEETSRKST
ncbi:uncharacterized protein LOC110006767 [Amborella trichopoda]|uniref:uncharacterized protein LOC110006767 n=1 Tax=Amborella trichopoda TaxID=13333 RepID=UPI0009BF68F3|nr:uncharacterized protein LOC110006767 [Amborella trichopoda]|eukprot:XP_020519503.1 uncharacterized protein LOC110006767 [Amborella trichopoda]